jgi:hypothetical protein
MSDVKFNREEELLLKLNTDITMSSKFELYMNYYKSNKIKEDKKGWTIGMNG